VDEAEPSAQGRVGRDPIEMARDNWRQHGWDDAEAGMAVVTSIMRAQQLILGSVESALKPFNLTFARYEVLMLLFFSRRGALPVGLVGERLQVHPASVTNAVDRLQADGLVERRRNPSDGRSVLAAITDHGKDVASQASAVLNLEVFGSEALRSAEPSVFLPLKQLRRDLGDDV
jgi:DNA-binding MarR family transcriptional regulator